MTQDYRKPAEEYEKFQTYHELLEEKFSGEQRSIFEVFSPKYGNMVVRKNANRTWWINLDYKAEKTCRLDIEITENKAVFHWKKLTKSEGPQRFTYEEIPMEEAPLDVDLRELINGSDKIEKMEQNCPYKIKGVPALRIRRIREVEKMIRQSRSSAGTCPTTWGFMKIFPDTQPDKKISYRIEIEKHERGGTFIINVNPEGKIVYSGKVSLRESEGFHMLDEALETAAMPEIYLRPEPAETENNGQPEESAPTSGIISRIRKKIGI